jgi:hypothetical protein
MRNTIAARPFCLVERFVGGREPRRRVKSAP